MVARLWQMIGAKIFLVIFVDGVPLLEWAHGGRMASAWWEHIRRILIPFVINVLSEEEEVTRRQNVIYDIGTEILLLTKKDHNSTQKAPKSIIPERIKKSRTFPII